MANPPDVRFSQGDKDMGSARDFPWELPVPKTKFWDDVPYHAACNFLMLFKPDEQAIVDPDSSTLDKKEKLQLLEKLLRQRLASKDAAAAPKTLYDEDYEYWHRLWLAIVSMQLELYDPDCEQTLRMMIERTKDPSNIVPQHALIRVLLRNGKFAEAEATALPVLAYLDSGLGKESPQALGARRMIAHAVWKQGRQSEAGQLLKEVDVIIDGTKDESKFVIYRDEERKMTQSLWRELREGDSG